MKVYRVETPNYGGPYVSISQALWTKREHSDFDGHPMPNNAMNCFIALHLESQFGFVSISQLQAWFDFNERTELAKLGFKIAVYECAEVSFSNEQAVFNRSVAELIETIELI